MKVQAAGTDNFVSGLLEDIELYKNNKNLLKSHDRGILPPCSPSSAEWKQPSEESLETAWFLLDMVGGKGENKLWVVQGPLGWPAQIDWSSFKIAETDLLS